MRFFTSDLHHKHKNICQFTDRSKVISQDKHDEWLANLWNTTVAPSDTVWHLGDFSFSHKYDEIAEYVSALNGQKFFIKGNHDRTENLDRLKADGLIQNWYDYKEIKIGETKAVLFHFPIAVWHQQHRGSFMVHGHCHSSFKGQGKTLDVGLDSAYDVLGEHTFFTEDAIGLYMNSKNVHVADHHKERT